MAGNEGRIAIGLLKAILAEVGGHKGVVLGAVLERTGLLDPSAERKSPTPCQINFTRLAEQTGLNRATLSEAKTMLLEAGTLVDTPDGLLLDENYETGWRRATFLKKGSVRAYCGVSGNPDTPAGGDSKVSGKADTLRGQLSGSPDTQPSAESKVSGKADSLHHKVSGKPDTPNIVGSHVSGIPDTSPDPLSAKADTARSAGSQVSGKADTPPERLSGYPDTSTAPDAQVSGKADRLPDKVSGYPDTSSRVPAGARELELTSHNKNVMLINSNSRTDTPASEPTHAREADPA
ncbi:hypothetical protein ACYOEI_19880, partial [Singulisphaera rosea]